MKLRYYLRGLGIGILVTAFLMGASSGNGQTLSDEEIKTRAARLGMVESIVLSDLDPSKAAEPTQEQTAESAGLPEDTKGTDNTVGQEQEAGGTENSDTPEKAKKPDNTDRSEADSQAENASRPDNSGQPDKTNHADNSSDPDKTNQADNSGQPEKDAPAVETEAGGPGGASSEDAADQVTITVRRGDSSLSVSRTLTEAGLIGDAGAYDQFLCAGGYDKSICVGVYQIPRGATEEEIAKIITKRQ